MATPKANAQPPVEWRTIQRFLVVNAETGVARSTTKQPRAKFGEFVYRLNLRIPKRWGQVLGSIDITLPDPPLDALVLDDAVQQSGKDAG